MPGPSPTNRSTSTSAVDSAPRLRRDSDATRESQLFGLAGPDVFDGLRDEVVERGEVVRRRRQRQPGSAGDGAVSDGVEAAFAQQIGGRADQRVPSPFSLGVTAAVTPCMLPASAMRHWAFG